MLQLIGACFPLPSDDDDDDEEEKKGRKPILSQLVSTENRR